jgi:hypothetical protein
MVHCNYQKKIKNLGLNGYCEVRVIWNKNSIVTKSTLDKRPMKLSILIRQEL